MKTPDQKTDERIEAAKKAAKSGSRKDLKEYLRLRLEIEMRPYRGIALGNKKWYYGSCVKIDDRCFIVNPDAGFALCGCGASRFAGYVEVIPSTVGQSTDVFDKNKKEIFGSIIINGKLSKGGDRVRYMDGKIMEVFYSPNGYAGWKLKRKPDHGKGLLVYGLYHHKGESGTEEIISSIHDEEAEE